MFKRNIVQSTVYTTDEKFEILEQLACVVNASLNSSNVQVSPNMIEKPPSARKAGKRSYLVLQMEKNMAESLNPRQNRRMTLKGDFKHIFNLISPKGQSKLVRANCHSPNVMRTLTYTDFLKFDLDKNDLRVVFSLSIQEKRKKEEEKSIDSTKAGTSSSYEDSSVSLPRTIIKALPIKSKVTLKALSKFGLGQPIDLYLKAKPEELQKIFKRFPSIPKHDRQNIFAGISLAQYLRKMK
ncbi:Oidioi.mRNA.OKI2018_I69.chr2.g3976.t1.cds [Oikopleura dioica]|uniref:Oidioi.mRNA.OKI2018_I69.chr2.g3976.t1.cds n=1 Tax=Oikopleura dioica TaxID=34765 RepID=A0ABN7SVV3_OIKDI|nr:Oidioi.mRNA.OKI2018_I69.chr2.g3976.t1.cds [Oikopleura dioica]